MFCLVVVMFVYIKKPSLESKAWVGRSWMSFEWVVMSFEGVEWVWVQSPVICSPF